MAHPAGTPASPETEESRPRTTASLLGAFREELLDEGFTTDAAEELVQMAAPRLLESGLEVEPEEPASAGGTVTVKIQPKLDRDELERVVTEAQQEAADFVRTAAETNAAANQSNRP